MSAYITRYFGVVFLFVTGISVAAQQDATQPVLKDGDSWQFTINQKGSVVSTTERITGTIELVYSQGTVKVYEVIGDQKSELDIKPGGPGDGLAALVGQQELRPTLKFPLSVGQKWSYEYVSRPAGSKDDQKRSVDVAVTGTEQVTTPAGVFNAYKLVRKENFQIRRGRNTAWVTGTVTYFYSPETRSIVKSQTMNDANPAVSETELIKFTPAK